MTIEEHCRWLSRKFYVIGMEAEDIYQEAMFAAWLADPGYEKRKATQRVYDLMKIGQRRRFDTLGDREVVAHSDPADIVEARVRLTAVLETHLTDVERVALGRRIRGEGNSEPRLANAWWRVRAKLAAA